MKLLKKYLLLSYSQTFFPIFLTLYIITSIVYLVKIAALTSVIQIDLMELLELYSFVIPTILYFTLPVCIFISLVLTLSKLSSEYELIVITSFGLNPIKILKLLFPIILLSTIFLFINSLILVPKADYLDTAFIEKKKNEVQFNIRPSEYGQAFGDWLVYVNGEDKKGIYKDIVLFQKNQDEDVFIIAKRATIKNENFTLTLNLEEGKVIKIHEKLNQVDFKKMTIYNELKTSASINTLNDILLYWSDINKDKTKMYRFVSGVLSSIFPIVSLLFIISLGYYNPRYDKNHITSISIVLTVVFMLISQKLSKEFGIITLYSLPVIWFAFSYLYYSLTVKKQY